jgi:hypothetical protein
MIMRIDEPRHDRHLPGIECLRPLADQRLVYRSLKPTARRRPS